MSERQTGITPEDPDLPDGPPAADDGSPEVPDAPLGPPAEVSEEEVPPPGLPESGQEPPQSG
jgi:hypothetical protein